MGTAQRTPEERFANRMRIMGNKQAQLANLEATGKGSSVEANALRKTIAALQRQFQPGSRQLERGLIAAPSAGFPMAVPSLESVPGAEKLQASGLDVPGWVLPTAAAVGGLVVGGTAVGLVAASRRPKRRSSGKSKRKASKSRSRQSRRRVGKGGVVRGKRDRNRPGGAVKDRYRGRKVYRTKRGQPYILMANGKARFVRA